MGKLRGLSLVLAIAILISACGADSNLSDADSGAAVGSSIPSQESNTAPDFSLELGDGDTFMLSQEVLPVYMVFWAEW